MRNDDDWSKLKTVSSFDNGYNNNTTRAVGVSDCQEVEHFSPTSILVESLIEQLCKMLEKDPADQKTLYLMICDKLHQMNLIDTSYHMDEFEFMRSHYQKALYNLLSVAKTNHRLAKVNHGDAGDGNPSTSSGAVFQPYPRLKLDLELALPSAGRGDVLEWSRYANEFVELEFIARGGFGLVFKARHKLDDTVYAIKKINLRYQNANGFLRSLKEVKMLACLNHPNIVAYKAAWLEPFDYWSARHNRVATIIVDKTNTPCETDDSSDIVFEKSKSSDSKDEKRNKSNSLKDNSKFKFTFDSDSSSSYGGTSDMAAVCKYKESFQRIRALNMMQNPLKQDWATLFVQMELCEENMREWLDRRNRSSPVGCANTETSLVNIEQCLSVFIKVLKGIEYIHDKGIVHHDIKPSNIFVSKDLRRVQVGDFGLACCLLTHSSIPLVQQDSSKHKGRIGTKLYAAPEQINGICSPKSDIYSIGIILLELIQPFHTEMERSKVISQLKRGQILTELTAKWPNLVQIISETVCASVNKRPTASELLNSVNNFRDKVSSSDNSIIHEKDKLIIQLKEEIAAKNYEILTLKKRLTELNIVCE